MEKRDKKEEKTGKNATKRKEISKQRGIKQKGNVTNSEERSKERGMKQRKKMHKEME